MVRRTLVIKQIVLSEELLREVDKICRSHGLSRSELVRHAVLEFLQKFRNRDVVDATAEQFI
ncbi:MAG: ribbon-helix-helix domain-containing protein [Candidatus Aenigmatarchaeota archaeon]